MSFKYLLPGCLFLMIMAASCRQNKGAPLSKEEMQKVLIDVQLAEVYSTMAKNDSVQTEGLKDNDSLAVFYKEVFQHHHITADQFIQSLNWYRAHPDQLDTVYVHTLATMDRIK